MSSTTVALLAASPWILLPIVFALRMRNSTSLDNYSPDAPPDVPLLSVIVPARNEARNIERCVTSVLRSSYPRLEVLVVDDHSTDGTGEIARRLAESNARLKVLDNPPLPDDWFGKQWACATGALAARGELLCFTDADTWHASDLLTRSVNVMRARSADMVTVSGKQELGSFWERMVQPQMFVILSAHYGGTESVNRSRFVWRKIANGQFLLLARAVYDEIGGHAAVRDKVAEDLMLAQLLFRRGKKAVFILGLEQLRTRMYTSLREIVGGWGKNTFAGGRAAMPFGRWGARFFRVLMPAPALFGVVPPIVLLLGVLGLTSPTVMLWAAIATAASVIAWMYFYGEIEESPLNALLYPLGAGVILFIFVKALLRGERVRWKEREYIAR